MDRTAATTYLTEEFSDLASDAGFGNTQVTNAYNTAIDMSLRYLGYQETDLPTVDVPQTNVLVYLALLNYFALKRYSRLYALKYDVKVGNVGLSASRSQASNAIEEQLKDAEQQLLKLGYDVGGGPSFQLGRLTLDFNEPGCIGEYNADYFGW